MSCASYADYQIIRLYNKRDKTPYSKLRSANIQRSINIVEITSNGVFTNNFQKHLTVKEVLKVKEVYRSSLSNLLRKNF